MPLQNRVTPFGEIVAVAARGELLGNRGVLHDEARQVVRRWQSRRWIACETAFKDRRRPVMSPGLYTELFFLDEATSLAAGHRPCAECRRADYERFRDAWVLAVGGARPAAGTMDERLRADRLTADGRQRRHAANIDALPDGTFVALADQAADAFLVRGPLAHRWSPNGYSDAIERTPTMRVAVLTPRCTVQTLAAGYVPRWHESLRGHGVAGP